MTYLVRPYLPYVPLPIPFVCLPSNQRISLKMSVIDARQDHWESSTTFVLDEASVLIEKEMAAQKVQYRDDPKFLSIFSDQLAD